MRKGDLRKVLLTSYLAQTRHIIHHVHLSQVLVRIDAVFVIKQQHRRANPIQLTHRLVCRRLMVVLGSRWANCIVILVSNICAVLGLLTALPCRIRRLVARSVVDGIDPLALQCANLKIYPSKLNNVTHTHHLLLVVGEKVFEHLVD